MIVEDGAFLGSRCIVTEGVRIGAGAILAANVSLTASVPIIDVTGAEPVEHRGAVPPRAVVVPGDAAERVPGRHVPARLRADHRLAQGVARRAAEPERDAARVRARRLDEYLAVADLLGGADERDPVLLVELDA